MLDSTKEFYDIIKDLLDQPMVKDLKKCQQHYNTSRYQHSRNVAYRTYLYCKKHNLDYKAAARAGLLHDLFLYDWRKKTPDRKGLHAFRHPRIALNNALTFVNLNPKEQDIILKHMWPLTVILPKYKESFILSCEDKYCTLAETFRYYKHKPKFKKDFTYTPTSSNEKIKV